MLVLEAAYVLEALVNVLRLEAEKVEATAGPRAS